VFQRYYHISASAFVRIKQLFRYSSPIPTKIPGCSRWSRSVMLGSTESEHARLTNRAENTVDCDRQDCRRPFAASGRLYFTSPHTFCSFCYIFLVLFSVCFCTYTPKTKLFSACKIFSYRVELHLCFTFSLIRN